MSDRSRFDQNNRNSLIAVSNADGETPVTLWADPTTHKLITDASGGSGGTSVIVDGVDDTIRASVAPKSGAGTYNALPVVIVDGTGIIESSLPVSVSGNISIAPVTNASSGNILNIGDAISLTPGVTLDVMVFQVTGDYTGALTVQISPNSGGDWVSIVDKRILNVGNGTYQANVPSGENGRYSVNMQGFNAARVIANETISGAATVYLSTRATTNSVFIPRVGAGVTDNSTQRVVIASDQLASLAEASKDTTINGNRITTTTAGVQLMSLAGPTGDAINTTNDSLSVDVGADMLMPSGLITGAGKALLTGSTFKEITGSANTNNTNVFGPIDVSGYSSFSIQVSGTFSATMTTQGSNDGVNWLAIQFINANSTSTASASQIGGAGLFYGSTHFRYLRGRLTSYSSGTMSAVVEFYTHPVSYHTTAFQAAQNGTWNVGSSTATGSAAPANAFYVAGSASTNSLLTGIMSANWNQGDGTGNTLTGLVVFSPLYNGATEDRTRSIINGTNSIGTGIAAVGMVAQLDDTSPTTITENQFGNLRIDSARKLRVNDGTSPDATALVTYAVHLTTNTTTTPTAATAYISSITVSSEVGGTTSTVTIQDKQGTPLKLVNGLATTAVTTAPTTVNFQTPVVMTSGIDIVTAGAVAATIDVWINYYQ